MKLLLKLCVCACGSVARIILGGGFQHQKGAHLLGLKFNYVLGF